MVKRIGLTPEYRVKCTASLFIASSPLPPTSIPPILSQLLSRSLPTHQLPLNTLPLGSTSDLDLISGENDVRTKTAKIQETDQIL